MGAGHTAGFVGGDSRTSTAALVQASQSAQVHLAGHVSQRGSCRLTMIVFPSVLKRWMPPRRLLIREGGDVRFNSAHPKTVFKSIDTDRNASYLYLSIK